MGFYIPLTRKKEKEKKKRHQALPPSILLFIYHPYFAFVTTNRSLLGRGKGEGRGRLDWLTVEIIFFVNRGEKKSRISNTP